MVKQPAILQENTYAGGKRPVHHLRCLGTKLPMKYSNHLEYMTSSTGLGKYPYGKNLKKTMSHSIEAGIATANQLFPILKCPEGMSCAGFPIGPPRLDAPLIAMGEIKSINSYAAGLKQLAGRTHGNGQYCLGSV